MLQAEAIGNLGADARIVHVASGEFYSFSIADSRKYKDAKGIENVQTTWIDCILDKQRGDRIFDWLRKGLKVYVRGPLSVRSYTTRDNRTACGINIRVQQIELCGSPSDKRDALQKQDASDFIIGNASPSQTASFPPAQDATSSNYPNSEPLPFGQEDKDGLPF